LDDEDEDDDKINPTTTSTHV